jgi:hypothetical protein
MPRESKTTIQKLSSRQVRFLATPDSDPELTKVVANPINTSRDQKNNYAVDGLVKALKDLNPKIAQIAQKNRIATDRRETDAGSLAALQGLPAKEDAEPAYMRAFDQRSAISGANQHKLEMNEAWLNKPEDQTREQFITEWSAKAQADTADRSPEYGVKFLEMTKAETLRINMGGQAADMEKIAIENRANSNTALATMLNDPNVPASVKTLQVWRASGKEAGLTAEELNEDLVRQVEVAALDGDQELYDLLVKGNADGVPSLIEHPTYKYRLAAAQHKAEKKSEENDLDTQAKVNFANTEATKGMRTDAYKTLAGGGSLEDAKAKLNPDNYEDGAMYTTDLKNLISTDKLLAVDPAAFPETMTKIIQGDPSVTELSIYQDSGMTDTQKAAAVRALNDPTGEAKHMNSLEYRNALADGKTTIGLAAIRISSASGDLDRTDWKSSEEYVFQEETKEAAYQGLRNELAHERDPAKHAGIQKKWADKFKDNMTGMNDAWNLKKRSNFIYRTRAGLAEAMTGEWISRETYQIHLAYFAEDDAVEEVAKEAARKKLQVGKDRTFDESTDFISTNSN